jgi:hypothetical protein
MAYLNQSIGAKMKVQIRVSSYAAKLIASSMLAASEDASYGAGCFTTDEGSQGWHTCGGFEYIIYQKSGILEFVGSRASFGAGCAALRVVGITDNDKVTIHLFYIDKDSTWMGWSNCMEVAGEIIICESSTGLASSPFEDSEDLKAHLAEEGQFLDLEFSLGMKGWITYVPDSLSCDWHWDRNRQLDRAPTRIAEMLS